MRLAGQRFVAAAAIIGVALVRAGAAEADDSEPDPAFLSFGAGYFNIDQDEGQAAEFRLEYRSDLKLWIIKPFAAVAATTDGSFFIGGGILTDIYFGRRVVLTGSFSANYYAQGGSDVDLGYPLEFRSQAELAYRFGDRSRLGVAVSHYSNLGLDDRNPGSETVSLYYSLPLGGIGPE